MSSTSPFQHYLDRFGLSQDELSATVRSAAQALSIFGSVPASDLADEILKRHPEYAGGRARNFRTSDEGGATAPVGTWLLRVREFFNKSRVPQLHGRIVLIGLGYIEPAIGRQLRGLGILAALEGEVKEPLPSLLSPTGHIAYAGAAHPFARADSSEVGPTTGVAEQVASAETLPLAELDKLPFATRFDRSINNVLDYAATLSEVAHRPVDSVLVLASILSLSSIEDPRDTGYFLKQVLEGQPTRPRDGSRRGSRVVEDLIRPASIEWPNPIAISVEPRWRALMLAELPGVLRGAAGFSEDTNVQQAIHPRHIIGAILWPGQHSYAQARLVELGFDLEQLRLEVLKFIENHHRESERPEAWHAYFLLPADGKFRETSGQPAANVEAEEAGRVPDGGQAGDDGGAAPGGETGAAEPSAPLSEPDEEVEEASVLRASVSDQPVAEDRLGFGPYVRALSEFLTNEKTVPPLTLSVEGEWGSGKSSFMLQLEEELRRAARRERRRLFRQFRREIRQRKERVPTPLRRAGWLRVGWLRLLTLPRAARARLREMRCPAVRFNAWRHDKEDALWASFALEFVRQLSRELPWPRRLAARVKLSRMRFKWAAGWLPLARAVFASAVLFFLVGSLGYLLFTGGLESLLGGASAEGKSPGEIKADAVFLRLIRGSGVVGLLAFLIFAAGKLRDYLGNPLSANIRQYISTPDYSSRVAFIENFHEDFRRIVETYAGRNKVYVFVDDLDRCDVPKAAELMQALNLMIADSPHLVFIIGMDREKVAAGLAVKHEKLLPYLSQPADGAAASRPANGFDPGGGLEYGYSFIEKFIQLPFRVPLPDEPDLRRLLESLSPATAATKTDAPRPSDTPAAPTPAVASNVPTPDRDLQALFASRPNIDETSVPPALRDVSPSSDESPAAPLTAEQRESRRLFKLGAFEDSQDVRDIIIMVAPTLDNNPRRLKQFINLFRLNAYIVAETSLNTKLTLPQLGKWVALGLRWPRLLAHLEDDPQLLLQLHQVAVGEKPSEPADKSTLDFWRRRPELLKLLSFGCDTADGEGQRGPRPQDSARYGLQGVQVAELLRVSAVVPPEKARPASAPAAGHRGMQI